MSRVANGLFADTKPSCGWVGNQFDASAGGLVGSWRGWIPPWSAMHSMRAPAGYRGTVRQGGPARFAGTARTVQLEPDVGGEPGRIASDVIAESVRGDVLVMANGGRLDVSCWGGILSLGCVRQGVVGVIADGACRDVAEARARAAGVRAGGDPPHRPRPAAPAERRHSVSMEGVTVAEGDLVIADDSGVVFVPRLRAAEVFHCAEQIVERNAAISADIRAGVRIDQAMHDARLAGQTTSEGDR